MQLEYESLIRIALAMVLGAIIGLEREIHGRPAGMRTHALVCLASALLIVVSRTGALVGLSGPDNFLINMDPARMAAGIVTGIGFLGAGAILRIKDNLIRGLTTAASIWFVAAVGVTIGLGEYTLSVVAAGCGLIILNILARFEERLDRTGHHTLVIKTKVQARQAAEQHCLKLFNHYNIKVTHIEYTVNTKANITKVSFAVCIGTEIDSTKLVSEVMTIKDIWEVKWV